MTLKHVIQIFPRWDIFFFLILLLHFPMHRCSLHRHRYLRQTSMLLISNAPFQNSKPSCLTSMHVPSDVIKKRGQHLHVLSQLRTITSGKFEPEDRNVKALKKLTVSPKSGSLRIPSLILAFSVFLSFWFCCSIFCGLRLRARALADRENQHHQRPTCLGSGVRSGALPSCVLGSGKPWRHLSFTKQGQEEKEEEAQKEEAKQLERKRKFRRQRLFQQPQRACQHE